MKGFDENNTEVYNNVVEKIAEDFKKGMKSNEIMDELKKDEDVLDYLLAPVAKVVGELEKIKERERARQAVSEKGDCSEIVREVFDDYKEDIDKIISSYPISSISSITSTSAFFLDRPKTDIPMSEHKGVIKRLEYLKDDEIMDVVAMSQRKAKKDDIMLLAYRYKDGINGYDDIACVFTSKEILGFENEELKFTVSYNEIIDAVFNKSEAKIILDTADQNNAELTFIIDDGDEKFISSVSLIYNLLMDIVDKIKEL